MKNNRKVIIGILLLIVSIGNFSMSFAYWTSNISGDQSSQVTTFQLGEWDFEDVDFIAATFRSDYSGILGLTESNVSISDRAEVEAALLEFGLFSEEVQTELAPEEMLLLALLNQILALENSTFLDFEAYPYESGLTGTLDIEGRTWYANDVFIAGDSSYDVWNGVYSLAFRSTAYFESQDLFINGVDKITLYHGALNYNNGQSFQFKVEYELDSNPGVWVTLQEGGTDLIIDVISGTPLTYEEIDVNITEAVNIRFTPIISSTTDYINLDDIRIYEHIVSSEAEITTFTTIYAGVLALDVSTVEISDKDAVEQALDAYSLLSIDAQTALIAEQALLDSLLAEINSQEAIAQAENLVTIAENTLSQSDLDAAQVVVSTLSDGPEKTALQARLDVVQNIINSIASFLSDHATALALSVGSVTTDDQAIVEAALDAYYALSTEAQAEVATEKALLDSLLIEINSQIPTATLVAQFQSDHATVLALTTNTVTPSDKVAVEAALDAYDLLQIDAQNALTAEKALLDSLLVEIDLQEAEALVVIAEGSNLQSDVDNAQLLVTALPDGSDKTDLQDRLDVVVATIEQLLVQAVEDLIAALPNAGNVTLTDQNDIEAARTAYDELTTSQQALITNESILAARETELLDLQAATAAVVVAETTIVQADVDNAQLLVTALINGSAKTDLQVRLDDVQDTIDVNEAITLINNYFASNTIIVSKLNNATAIKETAFLTEVNSLVSGLNVSITITSTNEVDRRNTTYTIEVTKNTTTVTVDVDVQFTR